MSERESPDIGVQVQALRERLGLSIRGLAELCGLSPNTISLIERGESSPNVSTLHQLATALRVPITAFFERPGEPAQVIHSRPNERSFSGSSSVLLESLGSGLEEQDLEPFLVTLQPGADSGPGTVMHDGHELVYCLDGVVEYVIKDQTYSLSAGDSLLFEARLRHWWRNPGQEPAVFLLIFQSSLRGESVEHHIHS